jgi:hypothetical protein
MAIGAPAGIGNSVTQALQSAQIRSDENQRVDATKVRNKIAQRDSGQESSGGAVGEVAAKSAESRRVTAASEPKEKNPLRQVLEQSVSVQAPGQGSAGNGGGQGLGQVLNISV